MLSGADTTRPIVALDWSFHGIHVTFDGETVEKMASLDVLLADGRLTAAHNIVAESTFESWNLERRARLLEDLRRAGHELYVYRPLHTARARRELGIEKSDSEDVKIIWRYAQHPRFHVYRAGVVEADWAETFAGLQREYTIIRLSGGKAELAAQAAAILGPLRERSPESRLVLGASTGYSETLLAALYYAASKNLTRNEMERLFGLHGSGYPSLLRSEIHTHSARWAHKRLAARDDVHTRRAVDDLRDGLTATTAETQKDWRVYRRELRRAYAELRAALVDDTTTNAGDGRTTPERPADHGC